MHTVTKLKKPPFCNYLKLRKARIRNAADMFEAIMLQNKPIMRLKQPTYFLVNDPDAAQRIIQNPEDVYIKDGKFIKYLSIPFGQGLVTSEGKLWQNQRNLLQPYFHPKYLQRYADIIIAKTNEWLTQKWADYEKQNKTFDLAQDLMELVLLIAGDALFSEDLTSTSHEVLKWVDFGQKYILGYYFVSPNMPSPYRWYYKKGSKKFHSMFGEFINHRRQSTKKPDDILTALATATDPDTGELLPNELIIAQMITLLVTGHETSGGLLGWLWYELGQRPEMLQKLIDEVDTVLQGKTPSLDDLNELPYLKMVVDEALRLYPTIWTVNRYATKDDILEGYKIPKGSIVFVNPYTLQHDPNLWEAPWQFDPNRFDRKCPMHRHKMAYIPFGGGNRVCIGKNFALQEIKLIMILILQRYRVNVLTKKRPKMLPLVTLKVDSKLNVNITRRSFISRSD